MWFNQPTLEATDILATLAEAYPRLLRKSDVSGSASIMQMNVP